MSKYKFCPICGGSLSSNDKAPVCLECNFIFWQNSKPCVNALIINEKNEILLSKRATDPHKGCWAIVGGFLDYGEHPIDGLKREIKEELGVEAEAGEIIGIYNDIYEEGIYSGKLIIVSYIAKIKSYEFKINRKELEGVKWFPVDELPWDEFGFSNTTETLNDYVKFKDLFSSISQVRHETSTSIPTTISRETNYSP